MSALALCSYLMSMFAIDVVITAKSDHELGISGQQKNVYVGHDEMRTHIPQKYIAIYKDSDFLLMILRDKKSYTLYNIIESDSASSNQRT